MKVSSFKLEPEGGDEWDFSFTTSPNSSAALNRQKLILYTTELASIDNAVNGYKTTNGNSVHLLLGRDGKRLVQMVPFDRQSVRSKSLDKTTISLALDYNRAVNASQAQDPHTHIFTISTNNKPMRSALYPSVQLDSLLKLLVFLQGTLGLSSFQGYEELVPGTLMPGPAFPITLLRERLFQATGGAAGSKIVLEETTQAAPLRNGPGLEFPFILDSELPKGTPVSIADDYKGWVRVEVVGPEIEGSPWRVGWLPEPLVQSGKFTPVVRDNLLFTSDGRQYKFLPAHEKNFDSIKELKPEDIQFIIMHITTGTRLGSTVDFFRKETSRVSANLVIGRDGRVVQMVPFNRTAFHAGSGSWEETSQLNTHSIGIEIDNAASLVERKDGTFWRKGTQIPENEVDKVDTWKIRRAKPWHKFTNIQLEVTHAIVLALAHQYQIKEILEHERISLKNRTDPGPLYQDEMSALRQEALGRPEPVFRQRVIKQEATVFQNSCYDPPKMDYAPFEQPVVPCLVNVIDASCDHWTKIKVVKSPDKPNQVGREGWVKKSDVKYFRDKLYNLTKKQTIYRDGPPCLPVKALPAGTIVRVQRTLGDWSLVATPFHRKDYVFLDGWIRTEFLE